MSFVNSVKSFLNTRASTHDRTHLTLPQLNSDNLKLKMRLEEQALERGKRNLPPATAIALDDIELKIVSEIGNHLKSANESYYDNMRTFEQRMNMLSGMGNIGKLEAIAIASESDFKNHVHKRKDELYTARAAVVGSETELEEFKKLNHLNRSARYPDRVSLFIAIAFLLVVIETYINGMFFAKGHEQGIIGGFFTALIPSLLNASAGYCMGNFALRLVVNKRGLIRTSGAFLLAFISILVFVLNILVAHYRSAMINLEESGATQAAKDALSSFLASPFNLQDVESWFLFSMGCIFFLVAACDFWKMDDPYLHFGKISRNHKTKHDAYADKKSDTLDELEDVRNDRLEELNEVCSLIGSKSNHASSIFDSKNRWVALFKDHISHLENVAKELLGYYRSINMGARTEPAPVYFQQAWSLDRQPLPEPGIDFLKSLERFQTELSSVQDIYIACSQRIGKAYDAALNEYQTIEQLKPEEFKKWQAEIVIEKTEDTLATAA